MEHRKVVASKNLPLRLPLVSTLVWWLVLDKVSAPGWVWGVAGTILLLWWCVALVDVVSRDQVDVFDRK